jgi:cyclopropane fatty-acyl-phospholipid synthase-like methyltransferase
MREGFIQHFMAKKYGIQVWAVDLWIKQTDNYERIRQVGAEDLVFPIHADARHLPFAEEFFEKSFYASQATTFSRKWWGL